MGNRLKKGVDGQVVTYTYDVANRLTKTGEVTYTWDANGNLLDDGLRTYTYDAANRLVEVVSGTFTTTFSYNGDGQRVAKAENGVTTTYVVAVLGLSQVLLETTEGESIRYVYGHDLLAEYDGTSWAYHLNDGLGSVRQLADGNGNVQLAQGYTPFGQPLWSEGNGATGYGFTGERWEAYGELLFLRARYYEPGMGRFVSKDPWFGNLRQPGTLNRWAYVLNSPIGLVDLLGLSGGDPELPTPGRWLEGAGYKMRANELYYEHSLQTIISWRHHILAAAARHGFIPSDVCRATRSELDKLYTLAAIIYQESHGDYLEWHEEAFGLSGVAQYIFAWMWWKSPGKDLPPTLGIGQMSPVTALEIEQAGLLHDPGSLDEPNMEPSPLDPSEYPSQFSPDPLPLVPQNPSRWPVFTNWQAVRLMDPFWAIEYTAANLERAESEIGNPLYKRLNRPITDLERMAAWHNKGYFDEDELACTEYLNIIWINSLAIEGTDLLGVYAKCSGSYYCAPGVFAR